MFLVTPGGMAVSFTVVLVLVGLAFIGFAIQSLGSEQPRVSVAIAIGGLFFLLVAAMVHCGAPKPGENTAEEAEEAPPAVEEPEAEPEDTGADSSEKKR